MTKSNKARIAVSAQVKKGRKRVCGNSGTKFCFRCECRINDCIQQGCHPYEYELTPESLDAVVTGLSTLEKLDQPVRYYSDCTDTWFVQKCIRKLRDSTNAKTAFFAVIFYAHFLNIHTFHCIRHGLKDVVDFKELKKNLANCKRLGYALYRAKTLGSGALKMPGVAKGLPTIIASFRKLYHNKQFHELTKQLQSSIDSFAAYRLFYEDTQNLRTAFPGLLGTYRFKNMLDVLVAANWIKAKAICKWPVDPQGGTAIVLRRVYNTKKNGRKALQTMLSELVHRLRCKGHHHDHHGIIGMTLCFNKRLNTASWEKKASNGLEASQRVWQTQMQAIKESGL